MGATAVRSEGLLRGVGGAAGRAYVVLVGGEGGDGDVGGEVILAVVAGKRAARGEGGWKVRTRDEEAAEGTAGWGWMWGVGKTENGCERGGWWSGCR